MVKLSLPKNVFFSVHECMHYAEYIFVFSKHVCMLNAAYISIITLNSISGYRQLVEFPVMGQFRCACQAEESSTIFSGNVVEAELIFVLSSFLGMSSFLRSS